MLCIEGVVFGGELIGSMFWGPLADKYGRRFSFMMACVMITTFGLLSGLAPNYESLLIFRAIVGFGVGGLTVPFDLLAEFLPTSHRGSFLLYIEYFWTLGSLFVAGMAWIILNNSGWRVLTFITIVPVLLSSIGCVLYLPESPRWLLEKGRVEEAEKIVRDAAIINGTNIGKSSIHVFIRKYKT